MFPKSYRYIVGIVAILLLPIGAFAAEGIVEVQNFGDGLYFEPLIEAEDILLTVAGPCNYRLERSLREHGKLIFQLDQTTIDGRYRFEVTAIPNIDPSIIKVLQAARAADDNSEVDQLCRDGKLPGTPEVQISGFGVLRGQVIYDPESIEKTAWTEGISKSASLEFAGLGELAPAGDGGVPEKAQIISPDGVVYNSLCVGFDCPTSPTFGADTIRLQENNLRIHFDDTSTASSFPNQDWRIEANSQANGGAEYLRFVDATANRNIFTVEANAPSNSLYVDNGGRVGNGTANPVTELHSANGDTPTLRLEQTTASGFAAQTWDVAGNETSFFVRDATNGSTLPFRIFPGASSNSLVIDDTDNVGVGTTSPTQKMHLFTSGGSNIALRIENSQSSGWDVRTNAAGQFAVTLAGSGVNEMIIDDGTGDVTFANNLDVAGDLNVTGTKNFAVPDPTNSRQWLYYSALEGPEAGTYYRGTGKLVNGEVVIELPETFSKLTEVEGLTVQLTPLGGWHQLYVAEKSPTQLVVRAAEGGDGIEFDYFVQGVRKGYSNFQVERQAPERATVQ